MCQIRGSLRLEEAMKMNVLDDDHDGGSSEPLCHHITIDKKESLAFK
jgi:hypothetical protein